MQTRDLREQRNFGRGVGLVLALIGAVLSWRARATGSLAGAVLLALGVVLLALGILAPRALTYPARAWMAFAHALGWLSTRVVLGALFYLVITPTGALLRLRGFDPMRRRQPSAGTYWLPYPPRQQDPKYYERMF
jgi:hypothetical protein